VILFLEPDPKRAVLAFQRMNKADQDSTVWCKTVLEAQTTLWNYRDELTKVYFEHDLGEEPYQNTRSEESGMELIRYLENLSKHYVPEFQAYKSMSFIVHTWNDHAGPIMTERLTKIGLNVKWIPFGTESK
jgi:hypothetical protein